VWKGNRSWGPWRKPNGRWCLTYRMASCPSCWASALKDPDALQLLTSSSQGAWRSSMRMHGASFGKLPWGKHCRPHRRMPYSTFSSRRDRHRYRGRSRGKEYSWALNSPHAPRALIQTSRADYRGSCRDAPNHFGNVRQYCNHTHYILGGIWIFSYTFKRR